jgi:hypothetical protein
MQLVDKIERRRFVGREFLLWLWMESELFEETIQTKSHGGIGLWITREIAFSAGKETTRIKGTAPASDREARDALCRGKMPERAGFHIVLDEREASFVLTAETLALGRLTLPCVLDDLKPIDGTSPAAASAEGEPKPDAKAEAFFDRMDLTKEVEALVAELYGLFLALRLSPAWESTVAPTMRLWASAAGASTAPTRYLELRTRAMEAA